MKKKRSSTRVFFEKIGPKDSFESFEYRFPEVEITFKIYTQVIIRFLSIYVNDLFFSGKTMYFPLSGKAMLNKCGNWIRRDRSNNEIGRKNVLKEASSSLGVFWHHRPISRFQFMKLKKMTGSTNRIPVLERAWKKNNNIELLKTSKQLMKEIPLLKSFK